MTIGTDWVRVVAEAIENDIDDNTPYDRAIEYIIEAINQHCPFKPETAYAEVRLCPLDHAALRQELTEKGLPTTPCPECGESIAPSDLVLYMTTTDGPIRDAAWLRMYAEKIRNGTAFGFDIPNTIATTIDGIANRMLTRSES